MGRTTPNPTPENQAPETIEDAPPNYELPNDENHQETYEYDPSKVGQESQFTSDQPPNSNPSQPTQFPPQNNNNWRQPAASFPPQSRSQPQSFPPPQFNQQQQQQQSFGQFSNNQPQAFPPQQGYQAQNVQPQAYPQQPTYQQPNVVNYPPAGISYSQPGYAAGPTGFQPMPASPFHQNPQMMVNNQTTGVPLVNQNPYMQAPTQGWKTGLFDCMNDPNNAIITACFPCVTFGQIAEVIDSGHTSCATSGLMYGCIAFLIGVPCLISCSYRSKLRARFGLMETPAPDWITHCFCEWCALCQEYRELQLRGIDPAIGWLGNVAKSQQQMQMASMTPPPNQTMMG